MDAAPQLKAIIKLYFEGLNIVFSIQFEISGLPETLQEDAAAPVLLRSSTKCFLSTMKLHPTFHLHEGRADHVWIYLLSKFKNKKTIKIFCLRVIHFTRWHFTASTQRRSFYKNNNKKNLYVSMRRLMWSVGVVGDLSRRKLGMSVLCKSTLVMI